MTDKKRAEALADVFQQIADLQLEAKAILDAAKEAGENVKALRAVAKELITDAAKLEKKFDDENQLEMFREAVQIRRRKGLDGSASERGNTGRGMVSAADDMDGRGHRRAL